MDGEKTWKRLSFTVFISFHVIIFAQSNPSYAYIYMNCLSRSVSPPPPLSLSLIRNYEGKTKKSDSSFCRGPLMISLKWLTALNRVGNPPQSKQIGSVLETDTGSSCVGVKVCVFEYGRGGGGVLNEGDLRGSHWGYGVYCCRQVPPRNTLTHAHALSSLLRPIPSVPYSFSSP